MSKTIRLTHSTPAEEIEKREKVRQEKALSYLKAKFPDTEEQAFFTDYTGQTYKDVIQVWAVAQAAEIEEICGSCNDGICLLPEALKTQNVRPLVSVSESPKGYSYLAVRWTNVFGCKYEKLSKEYMYGKSGITAESLRMTFENYKNFENNPEVEWLKEEAIRASETRRNLILAGGIGTGKTHLAVAIAIKAMEEGRQAIFRLVSTMLDEIQSAILYGGDYDGLMRQFKTVPCLVLDDLGHENMTPARASYLHQIVDYRYVHKLQTIVTTNAKDIAELSNWDGEEYVKPMVSRILERGKWLTMENTEDYRLKRSVYNDR